MSRRAAAAVLLCATLVAACGGSDEAAESEVSSVQPTSTDRAVVTTVAGSATTASSAAPASVQGDADPPDLVLGLNEAIRFDAGGTSAVRAGDVAWGTRNRYTLEASAGQVMNVSITSPTDNAAFDVYRPDGLAMAVQDSVVSLELPESGAYEILVGSIGADASYELTVEIPAS